MQAYPYCKLHNVCFHGNEDNVIFMQEILKYISIEYKQHRDKYSFEKRYHLYYMKYHERMLSIKPTMKIEISIELITIIG